jgi:two-component sensor histidine kinase
MRAAETRTGVAPGSRARCRDGDERDEVLRDLDDRVRNNLSVLMGIVRFHLDNPPPTATAALSRVAGQILALSTIYDMSRRGDADGGRGRSAAELCSSFIANIERNLCPLCRIDFVARGASAEIPFEAARTLGIALGEMLLDAVERSAREGTMPDIKVSLVYEGSCRFSVRVRDASPPEEGELMAAALARALGGELRTIGGAGFTERELSFSSAEADGSCCDSGED